MLRRSFLLVLLLTVPLIGTAEDCSPLEKGKRIKPTDILRAGNVDPYMGDVIPAPYNRSLTVVKDKNGFLDANAYDALTGFFKDTREYKYMRITLFFGEPGEAANAEAVLIWEEKERGVLEDFCEHIAHLMSLNSGAGYTEVIATREGLNKIIEDKRIPKFKVLKGITEEADR